MWRELLRQCQLDGGEGGHRRLCPVSLYLLPCPCPPTQNLSRAAVCISPSGQLYLTSIIQIFYSFSPPSPSFPPLVCFSFCRGWCWSVRRVQQSDRQETPIYCSPPLHTTHIYLKYNKYKYKYKYKYNLTGKRLLYIVTYCSQQVQPISE